MFIIPSTDPIQEQHEFPHKPVLLSCLESDVADGEADPACHQSGQVSELQYFGGNENFMNHQHVLYRMDFLERAGLARRAER